MAAGRALEHRVYPVVGRGRVVTGFSPPVRGVSVMGDAMRFINSI
jgi:hypothetical protein